MTAGAVMTVLGALCAVAGLLLIAVRLLGRLPGFGAGGPAGAPLQLVQRLSLGPKQGVAVLRVADRLLVVAFTDSRVSLLSELDHADAAVAGAAAAPIAASAPPARTRFAALLARAGIAAALVATLGLPVALEAQERASAPAASASRPMIVDTSVPAPAPSPAARSKAAHVRDGLVVRSPDLPQVEVRVGDGASGFRLEGAVGLVVLMGVLTLLPALFLLMTSFTRILIVLHFLRSALGTPTTPPGVLLTALSVLLTGVVMNPVLQETQRTAIAPYLAGQISQEEVYARGVEPFREFMLANVREKDLDLFLEMSGAAAVDSTAQIPTVVVVAAFVTSELRTAFQMGFMIFLPFVVVDVLVASVLMSLGMFMLPPMMVSLPLKLLLFVLADGWTLVFQNLVASFR